MIKNHSLADAIAKQLFINNIFDFFKPEFGKRGLKAKLFFRFSEMKAKKQSNPLLAEIFGPHFFVPVFESTYRENIPRKILEKSEYWKVPKFSSKGRPCPYLCNVKPGYRWPPFNFRNFLSNLIKLGQAVKEFRISRHNTFRTLSRMSG